MIHFEEPSLGSAWLPMPPMSPVVGYRMLGGIRRKQLMLELEAVGVWSVFLTLSVYLHVHQDSFHSFVCWCSIRSFKTYRPFLWRDAKHTPGRDWFFTGDYFYRNGRRTPGANGSMRFFLFFGFLEPLKEAEDGKVLLCFFWVRLLVCNGLHISFNKGSRKWS